MTNPADPDRTQPPMDPSEPTVTHIAAGPVDPDATYAGPPTGEVTTGAYPTDDVSLSFASIERALNRPSASQNLAELEAGERLDDFDLLVELGSGAFARVFLARQRSMQRLVAVKVSANRGNEPQTLAQLDYDYIVRVFDQRILRDLDLRLLYMQYLPGGTLLSLVRRVRDTPAAERTGQLLLDTVDEALEARGELRPADSAIRDEIARLSWPETVAWLGQRLAQALQYASSRGVLHRDIKPANVLLGPDGSPKLADFNISFARNIEGASPFAYFGGSLAYMSPEQLAACRPGQTASAADLDTRSDIFSLAVVLWELLTGMKPFIDGQTMGGDVTALEEMLERRARGVDPQAEAAVPANCPAALYRVLMRCLANDRDKRWSNGSELATQFQLCLDPQARDLVDPPAKSWRLRLRPYILPVTAAAVAVPNLLAGAYNINFNQILIVSQLSQDAQERFVLLAALVNLTFYPLGTAVIIYWCRYVVMISRGLRRGQTFPAELITRTRRDTLLVPDRISVVVFTLWFMAGLSAPLTLQYAAGGLPARSGLHFMVSLSVCGAIAVAYPFFLTTFYLIRSIYPSLLAQGEPYPGEGNELRQVIRRCNLYLGLAASVPLIGVIGVSFLTGPEISQVILNIRLLCICGIGAFLVIYWLARRIESDVQALQRVVLQRVHH